MNLQNIDSITHIIGRFRVKELQECLYNLQLPKAGRKDELKARLEESLRRAYEQEAASYEKIANEVVRTFRRMQRLPDTWKLGDQVPVVYNNSKYGYVGSSAHMYSGNTTLQNGVSMRGHGQPQPRYVPSAPLSGRTMAPTVRLPIINNRTVRCVCGMNKVGHTMTQCGLCGVWQHDRCVNIHNLQERKPFYCETCRLERADPFWTASPPELFPPTHFMRSYTSKDELYHVERGFKLDSEQMSRLTNPDYQLQAATILLGDSVPFRVHWPMKVTMLVNGRAYRVSGRGSNMKLGDHQVDETAQITALATPNTNRISVEVQDSRPFALILRMAKKRSTDEVRAMMAPPETVEDALNRVRTKDGSCEDGLEVEATIATLRDPFTSLRITEPARFRGTTGLKGFDLPAFLDMVQTSKKWQCPHNRSFFCVQELQLDGFLGPIVAALKDHPDVMEVEVSKDGSWRPIESKCRWFSVTEDVVAVVAELNRKPSAHQIGIKADPDAMANGGTANGNAADALFDDESEDELEKFKEESKKYKRAADVQAPPTIICISDSDEDDAPPRRRAVQEATSRGPGPIRQPSSGLGPQRRTESRPMPMYPYPQGGAACPPQPLPRVGQAPAALPQAPYMQQPRQDNQLPPNSLGRSGGWHAGRGIPPPQQMGTAGGRYPYSSSVPGPSTQPAPPYPPGHYPYPSYQGPRGPPFPQQPSQAPPGAYHPPSGGPGPPPAYGAPGQRDHRNHRPDVYQATPSSPSGGPPNAYNDVGMYSTLHMPAHAPMGYTAMRQEHTGAPLAAHRVRWGRLLQPPPSGPACHGYPPQSVGGPPQPLPGPPPVSGDYGMTQGDQGGWPDGHMSNTGGCEGVFQGAPPGFQDLGHGGDPLQSPFRLTGGGELSAGDAAAQNEFEVYMLDLMDGGVDTDGQAPDTGMSLAAGLQCFQPAQDSTVAHGEAGDIILLDLSD
eukprot:jgi/Botrbrau1/4744/Bobra.0137s0016.1